MWPKTSNSISEICSHKFEGAKLETGWSITACNGDSVSWEERDKTECFADAKKLIESLQTSLKKRRSHLCPSSTIIAYHSFSVLGWLTYPFTEADISFASFEVAFNEVRNLYYK